MVDEPDSDVLVLEQELLLHGDCGGDTAFPVESDVLLLDTPLPAAGPVMTIEIGPVRRAHAMPEPHFGPIRSNSTVPAVSSAANSSPAAFERTSSEGHLGDLLLIARQAATAYRADEARTRKSLYATLASAYDLSLAAVQDPQGFARLLDRAGLKMQHRAPMTPILKLVFGSDYDKARLTEYAAVLAHGHRKLVLPGQFAEYLKQAKGGLKAIIERERSLRRGEDGSAQRAERIQPRRSIARRLAGFRPGMFQISSLAGDLAAFDPAAARANPPAGNVYHADPFLWRRGGQNYCFFETYDYQIGRGHISVASLAGGRLGNIRTALCTHYHLSFPFLFEHDGELFMMPESCAMKRIEIWRCTGFPDRWQLHATGLDGVLAADSSLAEIDGRWWLFTNIATDPFGDLNSELHLFQIDGPDLRSITPHPLNPVQFDARVARNAGRIIRDGPALLRPAQENSHGTYGYGLNLMRIDALSMDEYSEALVRRIQPDFGAGLIGCHHIDMRGDLIVFDSRRRLGGRAGKSPLRDLVAA